MRVKKETMNLNYPINLGCIIFETTTEQGIYDMMNDIYGEDESLPKTVKELTDHIYYVMDKALTERERDVIYMRYNDRRTLAEIGDKYNLGAERIRQIEAKAFRKMRMRWVEKPCVTMLEFLNLPRSEVEQIEIDRLDLSSRTFNALLLAKCKTIGDILVKSPEEIQKIRNLGAKSYNELKEKLLDIYQV